MITRPKHPPADAGLETGARPPIEERRTPRWVTIGLVVLCCVHVLLLVVGAWQIGITTDEPYHVQRLQHYFADGWFLLNDDLVGGVPGSWVHDQYVYAPVAALVLHGVNVLFGVDEAGAVSGTLLAYQIRHEVVALIGLIGVGVTMLTARRISGGWPAGVAAAALLLVNPVWLGQSMFNMKDVPVATGFTLFTLGLILAIPSPDRTTRTRVASVLSVAVGFLLAVGTRPGMWVGLGLSAVLLVVLVLVSPARSTVPRAVRGVVIDVGAGVAVATAVLWAVYPELFGDPVSALVGSVSASSDYGSSGFWWYVPQQFLITFPTLLLVCLGASALSAAWAARSGRPRLTGKGIAILLVAAQLLSLPVAAMLRESYLYNGLRQLLFVFPALAVLGGLGIVRLTSVPAGETREDASGRRLVTGLLAVAFLVPTVTQFQLYPYSYAYKSEGSLLSGGVVTDYWRAGFRELVPDVPSEQFVACMATDVEGTAMRYNAEVGRSPAEMSRDCRTDEIGTITSLRDWDVADDDAISESFTALVPGYAPVSENCAQTGAVTRRLLGRQVVISRSLECRLALFDYPAGGLSFGPDGSGAVFLLGGWTSSMSRSGIQLLEDSGSVGFELPGSLRDRDLRLVVGVDGPVGRVLVGGHALPAQPGAAPGTVETLVTAEVAAALGDGRFVVSLERVPDRDLTVTSLEVVPA